MKKYFSPKGVFYNYFWLITVTAVIELITGIGWLTTLVLPIVIYYVVFSKKCKYQLNGLDFIWIIVLVWMILTWTYNDYPNKSILILRCLGSQIAYMFAYWISRRSSKNVIGIIIQNAYVPLIITAIIGIYCFFFRPGWYVNMIQVGFDKIGYSNTDYNILEAHRLRSIFSSPYTLSYFCAITLIYIFFKLVKNVENRKKFNYLMIFLLVITIFLTMQRGPIVCSLLGLVVSIYYGYKYKGNKLIFQTFFCSCFVGIIAIPLFVNQIDKDTTAFMVSKVVQVTDNSDEFVEYRLYLDKGNTEIVGDGVGRHDLHADKYNPDTSIRDGEYMKIIQEQGYIGLWLFLLLLTVCLMVCVGNFKILSLEMCIIIMLLICMIGANPLSTIDKHSIIYWLAFGQIARCYDPYFRRKMAKK